MIWMQRINDCLHKASSSIRRPRIKFGCGGKPTCRIRTAISSVFITRVARAGFRPGAYPTTHHGFSPKQGAQACIAVVFSDGARVQGFRAGFGRGVGCRGGPPPTVSASRGGGTLPLSLMQSSALQPRREIHQEPLEELAASIKAKGVIQPIVVRPLPAGASGTAPHEIVGREGALQ